MPQRTWSGSDVEDPARAAAWLNELGVAAFTGGGTTTYRSQVRLNITDPLFGGAADNGVTDNGLAINAAIAWANSNNTTADIYIPGIGGGNKYHVKTKLTPNTTRAIRFIGDGSGQALGNDTAPASVLYFPNDLDPGNAGGVYAIDARASWHTTEIRGLRIQGSNTGPALGAKVFNMYGIGFGPQSILDDVVIEGGFFAGLVEVGDHARLTNVTSGTGNYYGIYYPGSGFSVVSHADNWFLGCSFTGCSKSSIGVMNGGSCSGEKFLFSHMGFCPYGFFQEAGAVAATDFVANCMFYGTSVEQWGNAAFYDDSGFGKIEGNNFYGGITRDNTYLYVTDGLRRGWIDTYEFLNNNFYLYDLSFLPQWGAGSAAHIYTTTAVNNNTIRIPNYTSQGKVFFGGGTSSTPETNEWFSNGVHYRPYFAAGTVAGGQCLEIARTSASAVGVQAAVSASGLPLAGVALEGGTVGTIVLVAEAGPPASTLGPTADGTIACANLVTPDGTTTNGRVVASAAATDRILGYARHDETSGSVVPLHVRLHR